MRKHIENLNANSRWPIPWDYTPPVVGKAMKPNHNQKKLNKGCLARGVSVMWRRCWALGWGTKILLMGKIALCIPVVF